MERRDGRTLTLLQLLTEAGAKPVVEFNWGPDALISISKTIDVHGFDYTQLVGLTGYNVIHRMENANLKGMLQAELVELVDGAQLQLSYMKAKKVNHVIRYISYGIYATLGWVCGYIIGVLLTHIGGFSITDLKTIVDYLNSFN